jgi:ubiquinone/menaquinone biosynthesis C-methylase UbiE
VGAGSGFHAVRFARQARRVIALEPDARLIGQFRQRMARQQHSNIEVIQAGAEAIPLANGSVDYVHARFAYFFGTDACLPGLAEVRRVLRSGGDFFVIDVNPDAGGYAALARQAYPQVFHAGYQRDHEMFFARQGFTCHHVRTVFRASDRPTLANVFRMDYPHCWERLLEQVTGLELDYGIAVYHYRTPT